MGLSGYQPQCRLCPREWFAELGTQPPQCPNWNVFLLFYHPCFLIKIIWQCFSWNTWGNWRSDFQWLEWGCREGSTACHKSGGTFKWTSSKPRRPWCHTLAFFSSRFSLVADLFISLADQPSHAPHCHLLAEWRDMWSRLDRKASRASPNLARQFSQFVGW